MANINKIRLSGTTYNIQDENACKVVELTQAEYNDLPASAKTSNSLFVITDATAGDLSNYYTKTETDGLLDTKLDVSAYTPTDLSNYYTKSETSGATEISTALASKADTATTYTKTETDNAITAATSTKQDTLVSGTNIKTINNQSILGEGNIEIQGGGSGGGKAISAGTNISITTGETADTINCTLPITADTNTNAPKIKIDSNYSLLTSNSSVSQYDKNKAYSNILFGNNNTVSNSEGYGGNLSYNFLLGEQNSAKSDIIYKPTSICNMLCGLVNTTQKSYGFALGRLNTFSKDYQFAAGFYHNPKNEYETSFGKYSISVSASETFGDSGNTFFSVANGYDTGKEHNAFEIRQNGDIYIADTNDTSTSNWYEKPMIKLQDALGGGGGTSYTAGDGIDITNDVISVTGKVDTSSFNTYSGSVETALSGKQDTLSAGTGISIVDNVISATGGGSGGGKAIEAGTNISVTTGETADTINCTLPITAVNSNITIKDGSNNISSVNNLSQVFGSGNTIDAYGGYNQPCITVEGIGNSCGTLATHVEGGYNEGIYGSYSHVEGAHNKLTVSTNPNVEVCSHVEGKYNKVLNYSEHASGQYNNSVSASTTFGDSGNTLFSVGNGTSNNARHNAFEIRQNGDIYCSDGTNDVKLQDTITATAANTTALGGLKLVKLTQSEYDALSTKDSSTLYIING